MWTWYSVRKNLISFSEQEPKLINDTIEYNLKLNGNELCKSKLVDFAEILNMTDFLETATLDFEINEKNTNTSGGEKQKISILRALYRDTPVMIFDEPTSALDLQSSEKFMNYLEQIKDNRIILIITHDEGIIQRCNSIVRLGY